MLALGRAPDVAPAPSGSGRPSLGLRAADRARNFPHHRIAAETGISVLLVEQNARAALETADYGYVLETGQVTQAGPAKT